MRNRNLTAELRRKLAKWRRHDEDLRYAYLAERWKHDERLDELVIRARDAGMANKQIADALNANADLSENALRLDTYTPQKVTAMLRFADAKVEWAVQGFIRDALGEERCSR